jgi:hypothetical protein
MSLQPQPITRGTYRVMLTKYHSSKLSECGGNSINYDLFRVANLPWKWVIAPVSDQADTFTIERVFKDANKSSTIGMIRENAFQNEGRNCNYDQYQVVGVPGGSANWKIVKDTSGVSETLTSAPDSCTLEGQRSTMGDPSI